MDIVLRIQEIDCISIQVSVLSLILFSIIQYFTQNREMSVIMEAFNGSSYSKD